MIAARLVEALIEPLPVEVWAKLNEMEQYERGEGGEWKFNGNILIGAHINVKHALSPERLQVPGLVVLMPKYGAKAPEERYLVLIDGYHRLFRRYREGSDKMPVHVVPSLEDIDLFYVDRLGVNRRRFQSLLRKGFQK